MTGPEHYLEAERLLTGAVGAVRDVPRDDFAVTVQLAQVHATLALAAATAMAACPTERDQQIGMSDPDFAAWDKVCGVPYGEAS